MGHKYIVFVANIHSPGSYRQTRQCQCDNSLNTQKNVNGGTFLLKSDLYTRYIHYNPVAMLKVHQLRCSLVLSTSK